MKARILLFDLDVVRRRYAPCGSPGADPRHDTAPFQAFRAELLAAAAAAATAPAELSMWWEGTYNGYALAVAASPPEALGGLAAAAPCPVEGERVAPAREEAYPLARVAPGRAEVTRDCQGGAFEAPFGAPAGHFGAPGMRRVR